MPTEAKNHSIKELNEMFLKAKSVVLANYQGITAPELTALRAHMRKYSVGFLVTKNTLARKATKNTPFEALGSSLKGPVSIVISLHDPIAPAKALADYSKTSPKKEPKVICGAMDGKKITAEQVRELSQLPSREVLIDRLLSTMQAPTTNFVGALSGLLRKFVGTLDAIKEKKAGAKTE